ncbi:DUF2946 domain-containing protein [Pseudomonas syringae]|uniref:DUF2946 family protein n=1 Tax=Pseudomonas syringae TaxID=317 RepID=UPI001F206FBE|nr:DUF2946 family protein [Pseudomonas syringae]MCF5707299.1 DUF2946 domain-containing protein [Pseudomonas syringae]
MKTTRDERSLIAWALYASVVLSLFFCGLHHGQMSGLALSGLDGGYCSLDGSGSAGPGASESDQKQHALPQLSCPVCSSFTVLTASHLPDWMLNPAPVKSVSPITVRSWAQPPPRYLWPAVSPRSPPLSFLAV